MSGPALNMILNNPTCRGAFRLRGDRIEALKQSARPSDDAAERTRAMWASLNAVVPDAGVVIGKREDGVSVAAERGGMILEADSLPNLGILRSALKNEEAVRPAATEETALPPATKALLTLANWIAETEAARLIVLNMGEARQKIWAAKGVFGLTGKSPAAIGEAIRTAAEAGTEISLSYAPWADAPAKLAYSPTDLLSVSPSDVWIFSKTGAPTAMPSGATLEDARKAAALAERLFNWGQGRTFEVEVLHADASRSVIAQSSSPDHLEIKL